MKEETRQALSDLSRQVEKLQNTMIVMMRFMRILYDHTRADIYLTSNNVHDKMFGDVCDTDCKYSDKAFLEWLRHEAGYDLDSEVVRAFMTIDQELYGFDGDKTKKYKDTVYKDGAFIADLMNFE